jgi:hypothetical protein
MLASISASLKILAAASVVWWTNLTKLVKDLYNVWAGPKSVD